MTPSVDSTRPTPAVDPYQEAVRLAKAGRSAEASDVLRRLVASQPFNQAAWLWLAGVTSERTEAEAALAQARKINPLHPRLPQAEKWLAQRFTSQPAPLVEPNQEATHPIPVLDTQPQQVVAQPVSGLKIGGFVYPPIQLPYLLHLIALLMVAVAALLGLMVLLLGIALPVSATVPEQPAEDVFLQQRPAALGAAWASRDWPRAIAILEDLHGSQPDSAALKEQLSHAYLQRGIALRHKGFIEEAQTYFEQALQLNPDQLRAQQEQRLAAEYLKGVADYQAGAWPDAISALAAVRAEDGAYVHIKDLLYSAYYNHGLALRAAGHPTKAREALEAAIRLRPDLPEPRREMADLEFALAPQTLPATPIPSASIRDRLIIVGVAEQRMWVFEKNKKVFDFIISTGEPGSDTAIGDFEILNKIDVAYGGSWNLDMPYWMGIYWAGSLQNGIHSLPIVRHTGYKLWDGYLGQRVSYGCVILGDADAATLYNWAEVGTKVKIVWSLTDWAASEDGL